MRRRWRRASGEGERSSWLAGAGIEPGDSWVPSWGGPHIPPSQLSAQVALNSRRSHEMALLAWSLPAEANIYCTLRLDVRRPAETVRSNRDERILQRDTGGDLAKARAERHGAHSDQFRSIGPGQPRRRVAERVARG